MVGANLIVPMTTTIAAGELVENIIKRMVSLVGNGMS